MKAADQPRPFAVAAVLFSDVEADAVRETLEAIAPDQSLSFLLIHDDSAADGDAFQRRATGASRLRSEVATTTAVVEPNVTYFLPRKRAGALARGELHVLDTDADGGADSFGSFLASITSDQGRRSIVIVFASARVDADAHVRELQQMAEADGLVLVQEEPGGTFRRLPRADDARDPALMLVQPGELANVVLEHAEPLIAEARPRATSALYHDVERVLPHVCEVLLDVSGHDFSHYKSSTLVRRTLRRLHLLRADSADAYLERIRHDRVEAMRLFNDLLISVTAFFRDEDAWKALAKLVIPRLFERGSEHTVRVWVAGCATGEEAYSMAMLLLEYADGKAGLPPVQIFATDLDEEALTVARRGRYPASRLAHVSPERTARFFSRSGSSFQVTKEVREMVLFTRHSLTNDPPFSNLDLLSCRNLLIYLGDELHQRVVPLFHYALRPRGVLFLGPSETLAAHQNLFRPLDVKHRITERIGTARRAPFITGPSRLSTLERGAGDGAASEGDALRAMQKVLVDDYLPKGVVVTEEGQVVAASGNLEDIVVVTSGPFSDNITRLVRNGLRVSVRAALRDAVTTQARVVHYGASLPTANGVQRVTVSAQPLPHAGEPSGLYMVVFQPSGSPVSPNASPTPQHTEAANALIERLELDLATTRDELHRVVQDFEAVNEELKSSNEELLSMNEELQSTNEELESSKEELQATNEELEDSNNDLTNLLVATQIPTIFLDEQGHVRRVTPTAASVYNVRSDDIGRPLADFTHRAVAMPAVPSLDELAAAGRPIEHEVEMRDGTWYVRRVLPYVTPTGAAEGIVVEFMDITERRALERSVRESESRLRTVIDSMFAFVGMLSPSGELLEANLPAITIGGVERHEVIGRPLWECVWFTHDTRVRERLRDAFGRAARGETVRYDEVARVAGDGRIIVDLMLQPIFDGGVLTCVIPSAVDVTHRAETEAQLRTQRDITQTITDTVTTGILMTDEHRRCTYANPAIEAMSGFTAAELKGQILHRLMHHTRPDGTPYPEDECSLDRALPRGRELRNHEDVFIRKDGTFYPVMVNARVLHNDGEPAGLVIEVRDTTAELAQSDALRRRQRELQTLADNSPDILTRFDRDGRHVFVNAAVERATGLPVSTFLGRTNRELGMPDALCIGLDAAIDRVFATGEPQSIEFEYATPAGARYFVARFVAERGDDGRVEFALGVTRDRTAEKFAERALHDANRRKDEFLATLAHELRNPLAPVRNGLEILRLSSNGDADSAKVRDIMERQIVTMTRLIDDLLDISRISLGKVELKRAPITVAAIIEGAIEVSRPAVALARHQLTVRMPEDALTLHADGTRLSQVIGNLLHNAAKYTPDGGLIEVDVVRDGDHVLMRVCDNGIGIPPTMLTNIFEMFTQIQYAGARAQGGLGIGLALVRQLVEMHDGAVHAESAGVGHGSAFTVRLPLATSVDLQSAAFDALPEREQDGRLLVLVVDDNVDAARSLETILVLLGHEAESAFTGTDAVRLVAERAPDVVFLDIGLPDMSGYDVATTVRRIAGGRRVTLIALTGWGSDDHRRRSTEAGFDFHLTKPADTAIIRRILASATVV